MSGQNVEDKDFDILKYTFATLSPMDIPVYYVAKKEISPPLVVFNITGEHGNKFWDNEEKETVWKITVNVFARDNFIKYKNQIIRLMEQAGYIRTDVPACIYLEDIDLFNQPIYFKFYREND